MELWTSFTVLQGMRGHNHANRQFRWCVRCSRQWLRMKGIEPVRLLLTSFRAKDRLSLEEVKTHAPSRFDRIKFNHEKQCTFALWTAKAIAYVCVCGLLLRHRVRLCIRHSWRAWGGCFTRCAAIAIILSSYECAEFSFSPIAFPNEWGASAWQFEWNRCKRNESAVSRQQAYHYRNFIFIKNLFVLVSHGKLMFKNRLMEGSSKQGQELVYFCRLNSNKVRFTFTAV